jgi:hypothetical protein
LHERRISKVEKEEELEPSGVVLPTKQASPMIATYEISPGHRRIEMTRICG